MELELLKKSWESLDKRMQNTASFNQKLVDSIISSRVSTTVDRIKKSHRFFYVVLTVEIVFLIALFMGNPFDFQYKIQFIPYALLLIGIVLTYLNLFHLSRGLSSVSPGETIGTYLRSIVSVYDKNKRFEKWFGIIFLSIGLLVPLSFLPKKIEKMGINGALVDIAIMMSVTLIIYMLAFWLGAFKNRGRIKLEKDLAEWNELKVLAEGI